MTKQSDVIGDTLYVPVHNAGFVGLKDYMGDDYAVAEAARTSYGKGTISKSKDENLIRYLLRHKHTTPFEMCELKFHLKMPIFIARQWMRHRTASINEYSGRYSVMTDEFYLPEKSHIKPQSQSNKQGSEGEMRSSDADDVIRFIDEEYKNAYDSYERLLTKGTEEEKTAYGDHPFSDEYPGLARETARIILPNGIYTEFYWKLNLHNLMHFLKLRTNSHAQLEIRDYSNVILDMVKPIFPLAIKAWEDYIRDAETFSKMELKFIRDCMNVIIGDFDFYKNDLMKNYNLSQREFVEFKEKLKN